MSDEQKPPPNHVPVIGQVEGDGEVRIYARADTLNMHEAFGRHPMAHLGDEIRARIAKRRRWRR